MRVIILGAPIWAGYGAACGAGGRTLMTKTLLLCRRGLRMMAFPSWSESTCLSNGRDGS
eukprot:CAMPEP_0184437432 /NCGR_PEP_ID=MMETSP0738-20130409/596125_1 /TAXON_ID=385413 /ORGANISM="Thalassiosira miniscula, Strain CCMP1093" /LENGTH=58 /DNA_ID=CAMNT_0026804453 /DNA_START=39 /DNA_END=215 /DNA_ORIENTATION=-